MRLLAFLLAVCCFALPASAAELSVSLATAAGRPVANAVVMVRPQGFVPRGPIRFPWPYRVAQRDMQFEPFVLIVPVGAEVGFPNLDPFKHHVYSFSPAKTFELKLYGRDETRSVKLDKTGVVSLGCNIHDDMTAFIRVVDTPFAAKTDARGAAIIHDLPPGPATVTIWHPYQKGPGAEIRRQIVTPASGVASLAAILDLRAQPLRRGTY